jgi:hypothetical protein
LAQVLDHDPGVERRGLELLVAEDQLHLPHVDACLQLRSAALWFS